jgi:hypothetical protein
VRIIRQDDDAVGRAVLPVEVYRGIHALDDRWMEECLDVKLQFPVPDTGSARRCDPTVKLEAVTGCDRVGGDYRERCSGCPR